MRRLFSRLGIFTLLAIASGKAWFWNLRTRVFHAQFRLERWGFRSVSSLKRSGAQASIVWTLFVSAVSRVPFALVIAALTLALDAELHRAHSLLILRGYRLPGSQPLLINSTALAVLQLSIIIIGLYAAAFSVVASTVYGRVSGDIRELLLKDVASNAFLRSMAFVASYTAFVLFAQSIGVGLGYITAFALVIAVVYGAQTFVTTGIAVFHLFEPIQLLPQLQTDLADTIKNATTRGYRYDALSFQVAYQTRADSDLLALRHMLAATKELTQVGRLANFALEVFYYYESLKREIPSNSAWFKKRFRHPDWLTADFIPLQMALTTRTRMAPVEAPQQDWFERAIIDFLLAALNRLRTSKDLSELHSFNAKFNQVITNVSYVLAIPEASAFARALIPALLSFLQQKADRLSVPSKLEIADVIAATSTSLAVGVLNRASRINGATITQMLKRISSGKRISRNLWLPVEVYNSLGLYSESWRLERECEGRIVTPIAYVEQILCENVLSAIWSGLQQTRGLISEQLFPAAQELASAGEGEAAAVIAQRSYESSAKLESCLEEFKALTERLKPAHLIEPERWPTFNANEFSEQIATIRKRAVTLLADTAIKTFSPKFSDSVPDICGQAFHIVAHESFQSLAIGDKEFAEKLSRRFLLLAFASIERLRETSADQHQFGVWGGQIALDIFELCGYAIILSALDETDYWTAYRDGLDHMFFKDGKGCELLDAYLALARYSKELLAITPRSVLRNSWEQHIEHKLETANLQQPMFSGFPGMPLRRHANPMIRAILYHGRGEDEALELFIVCYALRRCASLKSATDQTRELRQRLFVEHRRANVAQNIVNARQAAVRRASATLYGFAPDLSDVGQQEP